MYFTFVILKYLFVCSIVPVLNNVYESLNRTVILQDSIVRKLTIMKLLLMNSKNILHDL